MAEMDLTLVIKSVLSPQAKAAMAQLQTSNTGMIRGTNALATSANKASKAVEGIGRQGKFSRDVLEAFVLYRGFVVLQEGAMAATRALVELEHEVAIVQTQLNEMGKDFQPLIKQRVIDTAQKTGLAFAELAKAEFEIVSANIAVADSFAILELSAKAAAAGGLDNVELAFNAALSQVNAFGMGVDQFDEVFDKQFNLVKRGIFTYEQFATIVGSVSEAFASMGQDVETANAALAAISQVFTGAQIERGATGLRNAVLAISEAPEKFEELGIQVTDAEGNFRNFIDIGRDLKATLDGMSELARAQTIKDIFPDERERRGINAFLGQLDDAEQFFVEQQFAVGDLDDAFNTVNATLHDQANILKNDVIPAFDPFVDVISSLVGGFNALNEDMPGFTKGLINAALAIAAIQATMAFGPGMAGGIGSARAGLRTGPMRFGRQQIPGMVGPGGTTASVARFGLPMRGITGRGAALTGAAGLAFGAGAPDALTAGAQGALAGGLIGGIPGAALGAAGGLIAFGIADQLKKDAPEIGASMGDSFADKFAFAMKGGGSIGESLEAAMTGKSTTGLGIGDLVGGRMEALVSETREEALRRRMESRFGSFGGTGAGMALGRFGRGFGDIVQGTANAFGANIEGESTIDLQSRRVQFDTVETAKELADSFAELSESSRLLNLSTEEEAAAKAKLVEAATSEFEGDVGAQAKELALILANSGKDIDEAVTVLREKGPEEFFRFLRGFVDAAGTVTFQGIAAEFAAMVQGDVGPAVDMLKGLGDEAESLADVMGRVNDLMEGFAKLQQLQQLTMTQTQTVAVNQKFDASGNLVSETETPISAKQASMLRAAGIDVETRSREMSFLEMILGEGGAEEVAAMFQSDMESQIRELFNLSGDAEITPQMVFDFLMGEGGEKPELQLGATGLADALFDAADLVRGGFLDGLGFSADNLEMFGEELQALNKLVRQRAILEELKGIAEFAGVGTEGIEGAMATLRKSMIEGGQNFFAILSDPNKLAELIANMEFGDISVDNSTQQTFVVRVSGDVSPAQISALQTALTESITNANREGRAR